MSLLIRALGAAAPSPSPYPDYTGNTNLITPGVVGFLVTFGVAVATVFLLIDMTRRIRRSRYREEVRLQIEAEQAEAEAVKAAAERKASRSGKSSGTASAPGKPIVATPVRPTGDPTVPKWGKD